jgi:hypothetical protein
MSAKKGNKGQDLPSTSTTASSSSRSGNTTFFSDSLLASVAFIHPFPPPKLGLLFPSNASNARLLTSALDMPPISFSFASLACAFAAASGRSITSSDSCRVETESERR